MRRLRLCSIIIVVAAMALGREPALTRSVGLTPRPPNPTGWVSLFDGRSLAGWKAAGSSASFSVRDQTLVCGGPGGSLFYVGDGGNASFEDVELSAEILTRPGASSSVYFHTAVQEKSRPTQGLEVQVHNARNPGEEAPEYAMTGSLRGIRHVYKPIVKDDQWFTITVIVQKPLVQVRIDGTLVVDYREPDVNPAGGPTPARLGRGTFALQCQNRASQVLYRNLRVRSLPPRPRTDVPQAPVVDAAYLQILELAKSGFPVIDLHAHLKGGLTLEQALALSRRTGMFLGLAVNCGTGFPIETDAGALEFLDTMRGQPVFVAMQGEGREWVHAFSKETRARFDYVFTDGMTWTNPAGRRMRLWMPDEVEIGPDEQVFMDLLVSKIVGILETEPIDIYVNPTFLPVVIAGKYDALWTEARMGRVIDAAVRNGVAIEINARYKIPSERFLRHAKAAGAKFTFGTNNAGATDLGDWSYPLDMQKRLGLTPNDMFVPGRQPSRAQRQ